MIEGREVVAAFDGGEVTSDAGALLLGATDRAILHWRYGVLSLSFRGQGVVARVRTVP